MDGRGRTWPRGALGALLLLASASAPAAAQDASGVDAARHALEQWIQARQVISQEKRDWELGRQMLEERLAVVQRQIDELRASIAAAQESIADADRKRAELLEENERLKAGSAALGDTLAALEERARLLLPRLPDPIRERVKPLSQRLPEVGAETRLTLGERYQNVVGILNEVDKFNREITVTSEVRTLADGTSAEVTAVYVGLGRGYYVSASGRSAGVGDSAGGAWSWTPADEAAPAIAQVVAILKNEQPAAFVPLPATLDQGARP